MDPSQQHKAQVTAVFDTVASGYDNAALRFFPLVADHLAHSLKPAPDSRVLDVACGTGMVSIAAGQLLHKGGRVQAIDLSENMLNRAEANIAGMALDNVDLHVMDAQKTDFKSNYFHGVLCSFGLFFIPDMQAALKEWLRVLQPGGKLLFSCFDQPAFKPMSEMLIKRLVEEGVQMPESPAWEKLAASGYSCDLLESAGAVDVGGHTRQFGYHLNSAQDWWDVIWNSGYRGFLDQLDQQQLGRLRKEHLAEVQALAGDDGIWMDVSVHIIEGSKAPSGDKA
jgi:ubiquinone/menaquinone biosynthesis C-methylase UbiE